MSNPIGSGVLSGALLSERLMRSSPSTNWQLFDARHRTGGGAGSSASAVGTTRRFLASDRH